MVIRFLQGWNDKYKGEIIDLPHFVAEELIRREIAIEHQDFYFNLIDNFWNNKDLQWNLKQEKDS